MGVDGPGDGVSTFGPFSPFRPEWTCSKWTATVNNPEVQANVMQPLCRTHTPLVTFSYLMVSKLVTKHLL